MCCRSLDRTGPFRQSSLRRRAGFLIDAPSNSRANLRIASSETHDHAVGDMEICCNGGMCFAPYFAAYLHEIIRVVRSRADYAGWQVLA